MKPSKEDIEKNRQIWANVAKEHGWLDKWEANGKKIGVWYTNDGTINDSIYLNDSFHEEDVLVLTLEEEE